MIYLDTHVVIWLYEKRIDFFSKKAVQLLEEHRYDLMISPIVYLEMVYLKETRRIKEKADVILESLQNKTGMKISEKAFKDIVLNAATLTWTRDPFDRIITAQAQIDEKILITKDRNILKNYEHAMW